MMFAKKAIFAASAVSALLTIMLLAFAPASTGIEAPAAAPGAKPASLPSLKQKNTYLKNKLGAYAPREKYIVVDTAKNILYLMDKGKAVKQAVVSSGSGNVLYDSEGNRSWTFDTPRGEFPIHSKITDPVWIRPDWAFIEEGENIPNSGLDRAEYGVLGDYAMGFGKGYFIHGTLYTRLLGYNVTHGCIRMADDDLKGIFAIAKIGTKVYIF